MAGNSTLDKCPISGVHYRSQLNVSVLIKVSADLFVVCLSNDWHEVKVSGYLLDDSSSGCLGFQTTNTVGSIVLFFHTIPP